MTWQQKPILLTSMQQKNKLLDSQKRQVFYSFEYETDVFRVQQIRHIGAIDEGGTLVSPSDWEELKRKTERGIKIWINEKMFYRSCVIVLIGENTASSKWVKYEIEKALDYKTAILGIYIHNLKCPRNGKGKKGNNPFDKVYLPNGTCLSTLIKCYDPKPSDAYNDIANHLVDWVETAILEKLKIYERT
ncbi:MAG: TIR domain-containing protein [Planktothrix agardhii]|uniref:TIR domain-containing protein n=1 Tax=Planktothrix agardhii TaxID=1160 RepID=UPI003C4AC1C8